MRKFGRCKICNKGFIKLTPTQRYCIPFHKAVKDRASCAAEAGRRLDRQRTKAKLKISIYRKTRLKMLQRDNYTCQKCRLKSSHPSFLEMDHKDGNNKNNDPGNLWMLCPNCHKLKTIQNKEYLRIDLRAE
jgi:5-methylcytosine-specific restriction endonuclease McrA